MDKPVTTRLPEDFLSNLKDAAAKENVDVSTLIRKLLAKAMKEWKIQYALEQYKEGEFSFGQLAEFAEVSVWDIPELLKKHKMQVNYDKEELEKDLKFIRKWKGK